MKKLITTSLILLCIIFINGQSIRNLNLNKYKYLVVQQVNGKSKGESRLYLVKNLQKAGYTVVNLKSPRQTFSQFPNDLDTYPSLGLYMTLEVGVSYPQYICNLTIYSSSGNILYKSKGSSGLLSSGIKDAISGLTSYSYSFDKSIEAKINSSNNTNHNFINSSLSHYDLASEKKLRNYFDSNKVDDVEGIYDYFSSNNNQYKITILKTDYKYNGYILESNNNAFPSGKKKLQLDEAAVKNIFTIKWVMGDGFSEIKSLATYKNGILEFRVGDKEHFLYKMYPSVKSKNKTLKSGEWAANGSGIIISKAGHIITNHHVIDNASDIEVEFILNDEVQKFNAEILQVDKINDLAIIKIVDVNFDGVKELPYNFKTRSSDVGTKVYAFGYPYALLGMGKEIKVTDGIISSKTGHDGNITTYQITAPIQGGNSGGPLFDDKGNLLGINSAKIISEDVEGVSYTIKTSYLLNLIDVLPKSISIPSSTILSSKPLTEQIKVLSDYVVLIKVK